MDQALHAVAFALDGGPTTPRHRIKHDAVVRDDVLGRPSAVGVVVLILGPCRPAAPLWIRRPPSYQALEWRWADLLAASPSVHFAWHSDRGAATFALPPLPHLHSTVTPFEVDADGETICDTPTWLAHKM